MQLFLLGGVILVPLMVTLLRRTEIVLPGAVLHLLLVFSSTTDNTLGDLTSVVVLMSGSMVILAILLSLVYVNMPSVSGLVSLILVSLLMLTSTWLAVGAGFMDAVVGVLFGTAPIYASLAYMGIAVAKGMRRSKTKKVIAI